MEILRARTLPVRAQLKLDFSPRPAPTHPRPLHPLLHHVLAAGLRHTTPDVIALAPERLVALPPADPSPPGLPSASPSPCRCSPSSFAVFSFATAPDRAGGSRRPSARRVGRSRWPGCTTGSAEALPRLPGVPAASPRSKTSPGLEGVDSSEGVDRQGRVCVPPGQGELRPHESGLTACARTTGAWANVLRAVPAVRRPDGEDHGAGGAG